MFSSLLLIIKVRQLSLLVRHAGLDPASRDPRKRWIPAFAGMTRFLETAIYGQTLITISIFPRFIFTIYQRLSFSFNKNFESHRAIYE